MGHYGDDDALHHPWYQSELWDGDTHALESSRVEIKAGAGQDDHQSCLSVNRYDILYDLKPRKKRDKHAYIFTVFVQVQ